MGYGIWDMHGQRWHWKPAKDGMRYHGCIDIDMEYEIWDMNGYEWI